MHVDLIQVILQCPRTLTGVAEAYLVTFAELKGPSGKDLASRALV